KPYPPYFIVLYTINMVRYLSANLEFFNFEILLSQFLRTIGLLTVYLLSQAITLCFKSIKHSRGLPNDSI
ncbi:MAG: hypothetical protein PHI13_16505, partial [Methylococcales bacterium]|nr:hypothetical protein [Methylococcales bacterium]